MTLHCSVGCSSFQTSRLPLYLYFSRTTSCERPLVVTSVMDEQREEKLDFLFAVPTREVISYRVPPCYGTAVLLRCRNLGYFIMATGHRIYWQHYTLPRAVMKYIRWGNAAAVLLFYILMSVSGSRPRVIGMETLLSPIDISLTEMLYFCTA